MLHYQTSFVMCSTIIAILISVLLGNKRNEKLKMLKLKSSWFWRIFLLTKLSIHCCWDSGTLDNRLSLNTRAKVTIEKQECLRDCESTPRSQMPNKPLKCDVFFFLKKALAEIPILLNYDERWEHMRAKHLVTCLHLYHCNQQSSKGFDSNSLHGEVYHQMFLLQIKEQIQIFDGNNNFFRMK